MIQNTVKTRKIDAEKFLWFYIYKQLPRKKTL